MTEGYFTCAVFELRNALANVIPFASKDETRPALCAVQLVLDPANENLTVRATDSIALIEQTVDDRDSGGAFSVLIGLPDAEAVLAGAKTFEPPKNGEEEMFPIEARVEYRDGKVRIDLDGKAIRYEMAPVEAEYVRVDGLWPESATATETVALNPRLLQRVGKVVALLDPKGNNGTRLIFSGANKPVVFEVGPFIRGMLMPIRHITAGVDVVEIATEAINNGALGENVTATFTKGSG